MIIGVLHPGAMGSQLARTASAHVVWAGEGRSPSTHARARAAGLEDVGTIDGVCRRADIMVSICPPAAAESVARDVAECDFEGIYLDANAVAPATSIALTHHVGRFVDGSVVGPPPSRPGTTRLYLAGDEAETVARIWADSDLEAIVLGSEVGSASALKMAYAGWTKGSAALLLAVAAYADRAGISPHLLEEWDRSIPGLSERLERTAAGVGPKAWRFAAEMEQIASAIASEGLPPGFHEGAGAVYSQLADLKGLDHPDLEAVIAALIDPSVR